MLTPFFTLKSARITLSFHMQSIAVDNMPLTEGEGYSFVTNSRGAPALQVYSSYLGDDCQLTTEVRVWCSQRFTIPVIYAFVCIGFLQALACIYIFDAMHTLTSAGTMALAFALHLKGDASAAYEPKYVLVARNSTMLVLCPEGCLFYLLRHLISSSIA